MHEAESSVRCRKLLSNWASLRRGLLVVFTASKSGNQAASAKPFHQIRETPAIFLTHCSKFQPQSTAGLHMPHDGFGPNLSFLDKKMQVCFRAHWLVLVCQDKQTAGAEIANLRSIVIPVGAPADIDGPGCGDTRAGPSSMGSFLLHGDLPQPSFLLALVDLCRLTAASAVDQSLPHQRSKLGGNDCNSFLETVPAFMIESASQSPIKA